MGRGNEGTPDPSDEEDGTNIRLMVKNVLAKIHGGLKGWEIADYLEIYGELFLEDADLDEEIHRGLCEKFELEPHQLDIDDLIWRLRHAKWTRVDNLVLFMGDTLGRVGWVLRSPVEPLEEEEE